MSKGITCGMCNGSGTVGAGRNKENCPNCGGSGEMD